MSKSAQEIWASFPPGVRQALYAIDVLLGGGVTVTERLAKARERGEWVGEQGCKILDKVDPGHCDRALQFPTRPGDS